MNHEDAAGRSAPTNWAAVRQELLREPIPPGFTPQEVERSIEATIRQAQAEEQGRPFFYQDIEDELEALYLQVNAAPAGIVEAKAQVHEAAQATVAETGCSFEKALFLCYHAAVDAHRQNLAQLQTGPPSGPRHSSGGVFFFDDPTDGDFFGDPSDGGGDGGFFGVFG